MRLFVAVLERDGECLRNVGNGKLETEIVQTKRYVAALDFRSAYEYVETTKRSDQDIVQLVEAAPLVEIVDGQ